MTFDKLPLEGDLPTNKQNIIYFSCDPKYWAEYGQYLAKSTLHFNHHQVHVHVHLMYEQDEHNPKNYIRDPSITYTFERHPKDFYDQFKLDTKIPCLVVEWRYVTLDNIVNSNKKFIGQAEDS